MICPSYANQLIWLCLYPHVASMLHSLHQVHVGSSCDGSKLIVSHVDGPFKGLGVRGAKRGCFAIGAVEQRNGCRNASAWRAVLGDVGKRLVAGP